MYPHIYEKSTDRLACALGGKAVLLPTFQYIPSHTHQLWLVAEAHIIFILEEGSKDSLYIYYAEQVGQSRRVSKLFMLGGANFHWWCVYRLVMLMFSDSHPQVHYEDCQCVYVLLLIALFACPDHSRFQWTAMYGLGGNTTRVSQTDVNLINSSCVQGIIQENMVVNYLWFSSRHKKHLNLVSSSLTNI
jgi:hypothetical protein